MMVSVRLALTLLAVALLASGAQAAEKIYQWQDNEGGTHYGDRPGHADARELALPAAPARDPGHGDRERLRSRVLDQFTNEREVRRRAAAEQAQATARRHQRCEHARDQLWRYTHSSYLYEQNDDGSRRILDANERAGVEADARAAVAQYCR